VCDPAREERVVDHPVEPAATRPESEILGAGIAVGARLVLGVKDAEHPVRELLLAPDLRHSFGGIPGKAVLGAGLAQAGCQLAFGSLVARTSTPFASWATFVTRTPKRISPPAAVNASAQSATSSFCA
jgi:hypothetical protein